MGNLTASLILSDLILYAVICLHKNIKQDMVLYMTQYAMSVITFNYSNSHEILRK